tara:strand:+ start:88 stop:648 length:561 start_codon:yes stop_codon:yes gene_type:complete
MFYPASGVDGFDIEHSPLEINSFIHVDYSVQKSIVMKAMREDFKGVGYQLIGIKSIDLEELNVNCLRKSTRHLNQAERTRLEIDFIYNRFNFKNFTPFALWAVYELDQAATNRKCSKRNKFSLLHFGGEACDMFNQLYVVNKLNPIAITLKRTGYGYGDNWTDFNDSESCLNKLLGGCTQMTRLEY